MFDKLAAEETRYEQLMTEMADPSVQSDNARFRENSKALAEIQPLVEQFRRYKDVVAQIEATQELLKDPDMRELAQEEMKSLEPDARQPPRRDQSPPRSEGPERREERRPRNPGRHRRRRSGALRRRTCSGCTRGTRSVRAGGSKS